MNRSFALRASRGSASPVWTRLLLSALLAAVPCAGAAETGSPAAVSYHREIRPLFQAHCQGCHQPAKAKGGYVLTEYAGTLVAGESGQAPVVAGQPDASHLLRLVTPKNGEAEMPRNQPPLAEADLALIRRWITEGAKDDSPPTAIRTFDADHPPAYSRPPAVASLDYSPDGRFIAVAGHHEVLLHRSDGSGIEARLIGLSERIQTVRFSPDGTLLATAGGHPARMGEIQIWDVAKRELKVSVPVGYDTLSGVSWSPDGRLVSFGCTDKTVRAIEAATGKQVLQQMAHEDWVLDTVFSTRGDHVISVGRDMTAKLTEVPTQRFVDNLTSITPGALRGGLQSIARHPARDEVLVGGADGRPQIYQVFRQAARKIGDNAALLRKFPEVDGRIFGVDYSPDGKLIAAGASLDGRGAVHLYAAEFDPKIPDVLLKAYEKTSGEYTKEEREAIERFTTADVRLLHRLEVPEAPVYTVAFSPDGRSIAAGTGSGVIEVFDVSSGVLRLVFAAVPVDDADSPSPMASALVAIASSARPPDEATEPGTPPNPDQVRHVTLQPDRIHLSNRNDHVQLIVTAHLAGGETIDVTRWTKFSVSDGLGTVSPRGWFTGEKAGTGRLEIAVAGRTATVPVDLASFEPTFRGEFVRDVSPVLARLGCNAGTCHGAREGKNGFKLSLRGYDPIFDTRALTDDLASRRVNLAAPDESLMLLKGTGAVPHEGGQRTPLGSEQYAILRRWIADGARLETRPVRVARIEVSPSNPIIQAIGARQQVRVVATYTDGSTRDVTADAFVESGNTDVAGIEAGGLITALRRGEAPILARFEGSYAATTLTVMGDRAGFVWQKPRANNRIDELVAAKWKRMMIEPSELCTDAEFVRRVSLDLTGLPPTSDEVREFLANPRDSRSKRDALIERLLNSPAYLDHWTSKWADLLQVNRKFLGEEGARLFRDWIRSELAANTPYDAFVRKIITASGSNKDHPAASYWKILRTPAETMENTTHLFLAIRFNCNKCHDHPFERWTQDQYYHLAQYFAQVDFAKDEASGDRRIGGSAVEGSKPLFEIVRDTKEGHVVHDRTGKVVDPGFPYPVAAAAGATASAAAGSGTRREALADWLTCADNRYFALSYVNRLWGYLLGVGLIEPIDDIRAGNPPSNPELLEHLTREFIESGFNTRHLLRQICQSRTYQLSLTPNVWNEDDRVNYSHALPRRLPAEVLFDSVFRVAGATPEFPGVAPGTRASQLIDSAVDGPGGFLATLGRPPRESACECERSNDLQLGSILSLLGGPAVADAIHDPSNDLARLATSVTDDRQLADELFLRVLNRPARDAERDLVGRATRELEREHARLTESLARAEADWSARLPALERDRAAAIARAELDLANHQVERALPDAAAKRERSVRLARAQAAVAESVAPADTRRRAWEAGLTERDFATVWTPLVPKDVQGSGSAQLRKLPDGSIRSTPSVGELPSYVVTAETTLSPITGIKLEVLPDADLPNFGPGHRDGDFFLAEFGVEVASRTNAGQFARVTLTNSLTDHIASGLEIAQLYNGIAEQGRPEGWRIGTETGRPHWAAFVPSQPIGDTNGVVFRFSLHHRFEAPYEIGRFRLWVTTNAVPLAEGLPASLIGALKTPERRRSPEQIEALRAHLRSREPSLLKQDFELVLAQRPLPADPKLAQLEQDLARVSRPVPVDPALAQLRRDVETSARQLANKRLAAVQDLAWALINTPAFLFNR